MEYRFQPTEEWTPIREEFISPILQCPTHRQWRTRKGLTMNNIKEPIHQAHIQAAITCAGCPGGVPSGERISARCHASGRPFEDVLDRRWHRQDTAGQPGWLRLGGTWSPPSQAHAASRWTSPAATGGMTLSGLLRKSFRRRSENLPTKLAQAPTSGGD